MDLLGDLGLRPFGPGIQSLLFAYHNLCRTVGPCVEMKRLLDTFSLNWELLMVGLISLPSLTKSSMSTRQGFQLYTNQVKSWLNQVRFEEGYDLEGIDPDYWQWLNSEHPDVGKCISPAASLFSAVTTSSSSDVLEDILVYPKPSQKSSSRKIKPALNSRAVCIIEE